MSRGPNARWQVLLLLLGLLLAGGYSVLHFRIETSIARLLPPADERLSQLARQVVDSTAARSMALSIGPTKGARADLERLEPHARQVARNLAADLAAEPGIDWVRSGPDPEFERSVYELYFPRRFNFVDDSPEHLAHQLSPAGVHERIARLQRDLAGPSGALTARLAPSDPLQWFTQHMKRLDANRPAHLRVVEGQFVSDDGHALVFLGLAHSAFDGEAQRLLLARIAELFERHAKGHPDLRLERSGINVFSVDSEQRIRADISRVTLLSTLGLLALFLVMFRSLKSIVLLCLPLLGGFIGAATACLLVFGEIHGLTLAFGASLLGVCIDYPIHLLNHRGLSESSEAVPKGVRAGLVLGALTTVLGISAMAFSGFEVMQQVAVFAGFGIFTALIVTLVLVPRFSKSGSLELRRRLADALARALTKLSRRRVLLSVIGLLPVVVGVVGLANARWASSLEGLAPLNPELRAEDGRVRQRMGAPGTNEVVVAIGSNASQALERNDRAFGELSQLTKQHVIEGFQSLHPVVWAPKLQAQNAAAARDVRVAQAVSAALGEYDFNLEMFEPFFEAQRVRRFVPLTLNDLRNSPLGQLVERFVVESDSEVAILSYPQGVKSPARIRERLDALEGVYYIDQRQLLDTAYSKLRDKVRSLMLAAGLVMSLLILTRFRRWRPTLATLGPALAAPVVALGCLSLAGQRLNLFHLLAALVVLSMAMDYGIFLSEAVKRSTRMDSVTKATLLSILLAAATTCLSFGLLGFSQIPVLMAIGQTIALGIFAAVALTPSAWLLHQRSS